MKMTKTKSFSELREKMSAESQARSNDKFNEMMQIQHPKFAGLSKVISGGQTGADRGGIDAAFGLGVETGGHAPLGYRTSNGNDPTLKKLGLVEDFSFAYPPRTKKNVQNSDGTVIIGSDMDSAGSRLTYRLTVECGKPCKQIGLTENYTNEELLEQAKHLANWIRKKKISVLNVAGNRDKYASFLHYHMTFKLIQCALLDLYSTGEMLSDSVE